MKFIDFHYISLHSGWPGAAVSCWTVEAPQQLSRVLSYLFKTSRIIANALGIAENDPIECREAKYTRNRCFYLAYTYFNDLYHTCTLENKSTVRPYRARIAAVRRYHHDVWVSWVHESSRHVVHLGMSSEIAQFVCGNSDTGGSARYRRTADLFSNVQVW